MSKIMDAMVKAKKLREASDQASNGLIIKRKTIIWITALHLMGIFILVIIFNGCIKEESKKDLILIKDRLEQIEKKLDQLVAQQSAIKDAIKLANQMPLQGSSTTSTITTTTTEIRTSPFTPIKEMPPKGTLYHVVKRGESLYSIAKCYGISIDEIRRLNNLKINQHIQAGKKLLISDASKR